MKAAVLACVFATVSAKGEQLRVVCVCCFDLSSSHIWFLLCLRWSHIFFSSSLFYSSSSSIPKKTDWNIFLLCSLLTSFSLFSSFCSYSFISTSSLIPYSLLILLLSFFSLSLSSPLCLVVGPWFEGTDRLVKSTDKKDLWCTSVREKERTRRVEVTKGAD